MTEIIEFSLSCPAPKGHPECVVMAHGGGGRMMHRLIEEVFVGAFANPLLEARHDSAVLDVGGASRIAFTTDSYVVKPLFFRGGDIGSIAVNGTVNDLAMSGARPRWISAGFIIEEGFPLADLRRIAVSMRETADIAGVQIVTGDTKVVDRGKGDGVFINTAGVGIVSHNLTLNPAEVQAGDVILLSGDIGRHGIAIMLEREGLNMQSAIDSDCACVAGAALKLITAGIPVHCMRDLTRGGLASSLVEISEVSNLHLRVIETAIPVRDDVRTACELLGFDPLYIANEGRFIAIVPQEYAEQSLQLLRSDPVSAGAAIIGRVLPDSDGIVTMVTEIGSSRVIDMLSGEQLPRIC